MPCIYGEDAVIRILDKEMITEAISELRLNMLGFSEDIQRRFWKYITQPYGMVLVTGPTGSGKTTTLYAALTEIKSAEDKIVTIEDPVEYQIDGITQIPVNEKKGLTFARGLRSILRHDPDKIMVGEIRDPETAHMQVDPYSFISALNCILAQRLIRVLCPQCKTAVTYSADQLLESGLDPAADGGRTFYEPKGCPDCGLTGYKGRTAIAEILELSDAIREMILERKPLSEVKKQAKAEGMTFLRETGLEKVFGGMTGLKDLNKVTFVE
jgi:type IV pilus assembly protein PilB